MLTTAPLTEREHDALAWALKGRFALRKHRPKEPPDLDVEGGKHDAKFREAVDLLCPDFTVDQIIDAAFAELPDPTPGDLCGPQAVARTRAYVAANAQTPEQRARTEVNNLYRMIGSDPKWISKLGALWYLVGSQPLLAYILALDVDLGGLDANALERMKRDAVLAAKLAPDDLPHLVAELDDFLRTPPKQMLKWLEGTTRP